MYVQSFKLWIVNFVWKLFSNIYIAHIGKENPISDEYVYSTWNLEKILSR